ncbi:hypothetical protein [Sphingosinicella soli]|uniref:Uncharacterized protein n=1 Tax=Sphingosinicella soli TaxID=333708 RepID=A0A7W7F7T1_9SPHN|nr:hypothetical protein [Sphingosinicella soli]MBB4630923.1 hypothetical protein [Sphingosinicella soli]
MVAATPALAGVEGVYRLEGVREAASGLELTADGRFRYGLTYGALDEAGEGRWVRNGNRILLTTEPEWKPPEFVPVSAARNPEMPLRVQVTAPDGTPMGWPVDVVLMLADGTEMDGYTQSYGYIPNLPEGTQVTALRLGLGVFDFVSAPFPVDLARANDLSFRLVPNSLGQPPFKDQPLVIEGDDLVMLRGDGRLTYRKESE